PDADRLVAAPLGPGALVVLGEPVGVHVPPRRAAPVVVGGHHVWLVGDQVDLLDLRDDVLVEPVGDVVVTSPAGNPPDGITAFGVGVRSGGGAGGAVGIGV